MIHPRRTLQVLAVAVLACATALTAVPAASAAPTTPADGQVRAEEPYIPPTVKYLWAGSETFDYSLDDGATTKTGYYQSVDPPPVWLNPYDLDSGRDVKNSVTTEGDVTTVSQTYRASGEGARFKLPVGQDYRASTGWSVLATRTGRGGPLSVWRPGSLLPVQNAIGGNVVSGIPSSAVISRVLTGGSVRHAAVVYQYQGVFTAGLVDLATYTFRPYATDFQWSTGIRFNDKWFATDEGPDHTLRAVPVDSPGTAPTELGDGGALRLRAVVGDQLVLGDPEPDSGEAPSVATVSATDRTRRTVFDTAQSSVAVTQDGSALVGARDADGQWWVYHLVPAYPDGFAARAAWSLMPQESRRGS